MSAYAFAVHPHTAEQLHWIGDMPSDEAVAERVSKEYQLRAEVADALTQGYRSLFRRINGLPA